METFIYKIIISIMVITSTPNCPREDGLYCLKYSIKDVDAVTTKSREEAIKKLIVYEQLVEKDSLIKHVNYAQIFLSARLDSSTVKQIDSTKIK